MGFGHSSWAPVDGSRVKRKRDRLSKSLLILRKFAGSAGFQTQAARIGGFFFCAGMRCPWIASERHAGQPTRNDTVSNAPRPVLNPNGVIPC